MRLFLPSPSASRPLTSVPHVQAQAFDGSGATLNGRTTGQTLPSSSSKGKGKEESSSNTNWGTGGQTLGSRSTPGGGAPNPRGRAPPPTASRLPQRARSPTPERAYDSDEMESDDESVIYISSDEDD